MISLLGLSQQCTACKQSSNLAQKASQVVRMRQVLKVGCQQLLLVITHDSSERMVYLQPATVRRHRRHSRRVIESTSESRFACPERGNMLFSLLGLCKGCFDVFEVSAISKVNDCNDRGCRDKCVKTYTINQLGNYACRRCARNISN